MFPKTVKFDEWRNSSKEDGVECKYADTIIGSDLGAIKTFVCHEDASSPVSRMKSLRNLDMPIQGSCTLPATVKNVRLRLGYGSRIANTSDLVNLSTLQISDCIANIQLSLLQSLKRLVIIGGLHEISSLRLPKSLKSLSAKITLAELGEKFDVQEILHEDHNLCHLEIICSKETYVDNIPKDVQHLYLDKCIVVGCLPSRMISYTSKKCTILKTQVVHTKYMCSDTYAEQSSARHVRSDTYVEPTDAVETLDCPIVDLDLRRYTHLKEVRTKSCYPKTHACRTIAVDYRSHCIARIEVEDHVLELELHGESLSSLAGGANLVTLMLDGVFYRQKEIQLPKTLTELFMIHCDVPKRFAVDLPVLECLFMKDNYHLRSISDLSDTVKEIYIVGYSRVWIEKVPKDLRRLTHNESLEIVGCDIDKSLIDVIKDE